MSGGAGELRDRLRQATLELFSERGFDQTTAAQVAERVGVTERTFFRHFADKREALFDGEEELRDVLREALARAPEGASPLDALQVAFTAAEPLLEKNKSFSRRRHTLVAITPALQERERTKLAGLGDVLAAELSRRGSDPRSSTLAAQAGLSAFVQAAVMWMETPEQSFTTHLDAAFKLLRGLIAR